MIKEIVLQSKKYDMNISITSDSGIDLYNDVMKAIIEQCNKEIKLENFYLSDSDEESDSDSNNDCDKCRSRNLSCECHSDDPDSDSESSEEEVIEKHHYKNGCYCDTCVCTRSQDEVISDIKNYAL